VFAGGMLCDLGVLSLLYLGVSRLRRMLLDLCAIRIRDVLRSDQAAMFVVGGHRAGDKSVIGITTANNVSHNFYAGFWCLLCCHCLGHDETIKEVMDYFFFSRYRIPITLAPAPALQLARHPRGTI